jgi:hypothetical protein
MLIYMLNGNKYLYKYEHSIVQRCSYVSSHELITDNLGTLKRNDVYRVRIQILELRGPRTGDRQKQIIKRCRWCCYSDEKLVGVTVAYPHASKSRVFYAILEGSHLSRLTNVSHLLNPIA